MRTRRQVAQQEQAGIPISPQRSLQDPEKPKRKRNTPAVESSSQAQQTTQSSAAIHAAASRRGTRASKRGRSRAIQYKQQEHEQQEEPTKHASADASDASDQPEAAPQPEQKPDTNDEQVVDDPERETPASPSSWTAHPVLGNRKFPSSPTAHPVPGNRIFPSPPTAHPVPGTPNSSSPSLPQPTIQIAATANTPTHGATFTPNVQTAPVRSPSATSIMFAQALSPGPPLGSTLQATTPATVQPRSSPQAPVSSGLHESSSTPDLHLLPGSAAPTTPSMFVPLLSHGAPRGFASLDSAPPARPVLKASPPRFGMIPSFKATTQAAMESIEPHTLPKSRTTQALPPPPPIFDVINQPAAGDQTHSLLHLFLNPAENQLAGSAPTQMANVALAVTTKMIPDLLSFIAQHPDAKNTELQDVLTAHPVIEKLATSRLTDVLLTVSIEPNPLKRKFNDDEALLDPAHRVLLKKPPKARRLRKAFAEAKATKEHREALEEVKSMGNANGLQQSSMPPPKRSRLMSQNQSEMGGLVRGSPNETRRAPKVVRNPPMSSSSASFLECRPPTQQTAHGGDMELGENPYPEEETADTGEQPLEGEFLEAHNEMQQAQIPETPRARGWGLASLLPSARSVSKFIPGLSLLAPSAVAAPPAVAIYPRTNTALTPSAITSERQTNHAAAPTIQIHNVNIPSTPQQKAQPQRVAHTEPHLNVKAVAPLVDPGIPNTTARPAHRRPHESKPKKMLLTKGELEERRKKHKAEQEFIEAQMGLLREEDAKKNEEAERAKNRPNPFERRAKAQAEARARKETARVADEEAAAAAREMESQQMMGGKRKRLPSPDVIPNPSGGGFGMDLDYFGFDSDDEEDDGVGPVTPIKERPSKRTRFTKSGGEVIGDPLRATPYDGTRFAASTSSSSQEVNVFGTQTSAENGAGADDEALNMTPVPPGPTIVFRVPSPSDSDFSDGESDEGVEGSTTPTPPPTNNKHLSMQTSPLASKSSLHSPTSTPPQRSNQSAPPPRPTTHSSITNSGPTASTLDAISKARDQALKHKPREPSRLRESQRLSTTSTIAGSDIVEGEIHDEASEVQSRYLARSQPLPPGLSQTVTDFPRTLQPSGMYQPSRNSQPSEGSAASVSRIERRKNASNYTEYHEFIPPRVGELISNTWDHIGDSNAAKKEFEEELAAFAQQQQALTVLAPTTAGQATFTNQEYEMSPKIQAFLDSTWDVDSEDIAGLDFRSELSTFGAEPAAVASAT